jgi:hypothetical protein
MISESDLPPEPGTVLAHTWALSVFRVEDHVAQQRVLRALRRLGRADLTAMGTRRGSETFVVIDWDSASCGFPPTEVVLTADRRAMTTFTSRREVVLR